MVDYDDAAIVEPVVSPRVGPLWTRHLIEAMTQQAADVTGPRRQIEYREAVVLPLALEPRCLELLDRAQRAVAAILISGVYARDLRSVIDAAVLRRNLWEIAVSLREISELVLDMVAATVGTIGSMAATVLASQNRAIVLARDSIAARVVTLEQLAEHVSAVEAARMDWEISHRLAAKNDRYLDLVARTAADEHANAEVVGMVARAAELEQAMRETLQGAVLAAETLALPLWPVMAGPATP